MTEPSTPPQNQQATNSMILGILSLILSFFTLAPGLLSALGCAGAVGALLALAAGVMGLRAASTPEMPGRGRAIAGMVAGGIGLLVFGAAMFGAVAEGQAELERVVAGATEMPSATAVFEGEGFTLAYPQDWQSLDVSQQAFCQRADVTCQLAIAHPSEDGTSLNVVTINLGEEMALQDADELMWSSFRASTPEVELASRVEVELDGRAAIQRRFSAPANNTPDGRAQVLQTFTIRGQTLYQFTGWAPDEEAMNAHLEELEAIIGSVEFTG